MAVCSSCGATNREGARFCDSCGAPLDEALELLEETERVAAADDLEPQSRRRMVKARILARRGDLAAADELLPRSRGDRRPDGLHDPDLELAFAQADVARVAAAPRPSGER